MPKVKMEISQNDLDLAAKTTIRGLKAEITRVERQHKRLQERADQLKRENQDLEYRLATQQAVVNKLTEIADLLGWTRRDEYV